MEFLQIADFIGLFAFASAGVLAAMRKELDFIGVFFCGFVTALGGGILRDLIISIPSHSFQNQTILVFTSMVIFFVYLLAEKILKIEKIVRIADAIGLSSFTVVGAQIALENEITVLGSILLGVITGVGGGIIREISLQKIPILFQKELYAIGAFLGASGFTVFQTQNIFNTKTNLIIWSIVIFVFRLVTIYKNVHLPIKKI